MTTGEWRDVAEWQDVDFAKTDARYVRVTATSSISGTQFAAVAEMAIYGSPAPQSGHAPLARPADKPGTCTTVTDPSLILGAASVEAGATVEAQLSGFAPEATVSIWLDELRLAEAPVDGEGALTTPLLIPAATAAGERRVVVKDAAGTVLASAPLTVTRTTVPVVPTVTVAVGTVQTGAAVGVQLRGFEPGALVQLWLQSDPVWVGEATVSAEGEAATSVTVPASTPAGARSIVVTDAEGAELARTPLVVTAAPTTGGGGGSGGGLAATGADGMLWSSAALAALVLMTLGAVLWTRRPRLS